MKRTKQSVEQNWQAWVDTLGREHSGLNQSPNPPASEQALSAVEQTLGVTLPESFRALYRLHDGGPDPNTLFQGYSFMSLDAVMTAYWTVGKALEDLDEDDLTMMSDELSVTPPNAIKQQYFNRAWIPFAADGGGNYIGVDLDPGEKGAAGQVINFGRDDLEMFVIAQDVAGFLEVLQHLVEEGPRQGRGLVHDLRTYLYG